MNDLSFSRYLSYLLRHNPEDIGLNMSIEGWVDVNELLQQLKLKSKFKEITIEDLDRIVKEDSKQRYRFDVEHSRIRACQGHSIPWVVPITTTDTPPEVLYHGTTWKAFDSIMVDGMIRRMSRHAVHLTADSEVAMVSASRHRFAKPVVLDIRAGDMHRHGYVFKVSDNGVWLTDHVPTEFISVRTLRE